ncbi:MAG TPA: ATP-binding protein, partial [Elusimicrobiales bacterium]|nr:ATP-binding protein [Elusimicrobiales bacterium]
MAEDTETKIAWLNFLKAFTRALVQVNLYKADHPQVRQALEESHTLLNGILRSSPNREFSLTLDGDKLIANRSPFLTADKLPNSLKNIFSRFQVQTMTFAEGVSQDDIRILCQMQAFKGDWREYLKQNNVDKVRLSSAVYAKVDGKPAADAEDQAGQPPAADTGPAAAAVTESVGAEIASRDLQSAINLIVSKATADADEQKRVMEIVERKLKEEIEAQVGKAITSIRMEKRKVENDMARTEAVISNIAEGVVVVDKDGKILMMNQQAETISGKGLNELAGKRILDVASLENQVLSLSREIRSEGGRDVTPEVVSRGKDELNEAIKMSTAIIQNEEGKIVGSVSIPTDQAKFREVERLQQDFMANMTHELRSPLTSIKAALEILSRDLKSDEAGKGILNTAIRNSERLNSIISDILDFSKMQSGKLVFHQENTPSGAIAEEAADAMRTWASSKGITIKMEVEPGVPPVYADRRRTVQILINLLSNAIKFTPQGGTIDVSVDAGREALGGLVFFSVRDTGCGISKEDQGKIFEKFVQVAAGEKVGGTGLGLAITKAMAVMQG